MRPLLVLCSPFSLCLPLSPSFIFVVSLTPYGPCTVPLFHQRDSRGALFPSETFNHSPTVHGSVGGVLFGAGISIQGSKDWLAGGGLRGSAPRALRQEFSLFEAAYECDERKLFEISGTA